MAMSNDVGQPVLENVADDPPDVAPPRPVGLPRELMVRQHVPQHFGEGGNLVRLDHAPEVLHGNHPIGQELHEDARARPLLLLVGHGAVLHDARVEEQVARVAYERNKLFLVLIISHAS